MSKIEILPPTRTAAQRLALEVRGLKKNYGNTIALDGINLSIPYGQVLGILGPNGAGKTTLIEILEGITSFDAGSVSVLGFDVGRSPQALRGKINVTMQGGSLPPTLEVAELVSLYLSIYRSTETVTAILERVGLTGKQNSRIGRLSGGQRQRVALALALIGRSGLMLLDEPTSELDPQGRRLVWESIQRDVRAEKCTVIITTHQMEEAATLCDQVVILNQGKIIAAGTPTELIQTYCPGLTLLVRCTRTLDKATVAAEFGGECTDTPTGVSIRVACDNFSAAMEKAEHARQTMNMHILEMTVETKTLEDVFLHLTGRGLRD